ncbi:MAG: signal peptidase I [Leptospira sp.]|nr:signal peptidase I [Leptospira sp.]
MQKRNSKNDLFIKRNKESKQDSRKSIQRIIIRILISIFAGSILALTIRQFLIYPIRMENNFMAPEWKTGKLVFITPIFRKENLLIGDTVLSRSPLDPQRVFISRIAAKAGDKFEIKDKDTLRNGNPIRLNAGKVLFTDTRVFPSSFSKRDNTGEIYVKEGTFFLLSDNRDESLDSRELGLIPESNIIGKIIF